MKVDRLPAVAAQHLVEDVLAVELLGEREEGVQLGRPPRVVVALLMEQLEHDALHSLLVGRRAVEGEALLGRGR